MEKTIDRTDLFKKYQGRWIALADDDKFICAGKTLDEVMKKSKIEGCDQPVTIKVPDFSRELVLHVKSH